MATKPSAKPRLSLAAFACGVAVGVVTTLAATWPFRGGGAPAPQRRDLPRRVFELNRGSEKTVFLFGQVHPSPAGSYAEDARVRDSQVFIAVELGRLLEERAVDRILGEGVRYPAAIPFEPALATSADAIEAWLTSHPREVAYTFLKRKYGPALELMSSTEAEYEDPSGNQLLEIDNRSRVFLFDIARALEDRAAIGAVIGLAHIPKLVADIQQGSVTMTRDGGQVVLRRPHVILYLTGGDFAPEAAWLEENLPRWDLPAGSTPR